MAFSKSKLLSAAKNTLRRVGLEVSFASAAPTERRVLQTLFQRQTFDFILDVGANIGQYGLLVRSCGYGGRIVSFEPLAAAHAQLESCAAADPNWIVAERFALGEHSQRSTINVAANSVSSSLLGMTSRHLEAAPHSAYVATDEIRVAALDECIEAYVPGGKTGLLKIDTQGYEMQVLRGSPRTLTERIAVVQTELSLVELYDGQSLLLDVCNYLSRYNFVLRDIIPGLKDPASGRLLQLDGIFTRD